MNIPDHTIQALAECHEVRGVAQALDIPATEVARDLLQPVPSGVRYELCRYAGSTVIQQMGKIPVWVITWQCRAIPCARDGFTYLRIGLVLN